MGLRSSRCRVDPSTLLADVELQCIMRCLPLFDLLRFARCNRRLLHAAGAPFAFDHVRFHLRVFRSAADPCRGLLLHAAVRVEFSQGFVSAYETSAHLRSVLAQLHERRAVVKELDTISWIDAPTVELAYVLSQPCVAKVSQLRLARECIRGAASPALLPIIAAFQSLASLVIVRPHAPAKWWSPLAGISTLTELCFMDTETAVDRSYLPVVSTFPALRRLSVRCPALYGSRMREVFCTPSMLRLECLKLEQWYAHGYVDAMPVPDKDIRTVFAGMHALRELHLAHVYEPDRILRVLHTAPALQKIVLRPSPNAYTVREGHGSPSLDALSSLVALSSPQLRLLVCFPARAPDVPDPRPLFEEIRKWSRTLDAATEQRVTIAHDRTPTVPFWAVDE